MRGGSRTDDGERTNPGSDEAIERAADAIDRLEVAIEREAAIGERIDREGVDRVEGAADAYRRARQLLDHYEERATGTGRENFTAYVQLEGQFATLVEGLPEELADREAFEAAWEAIDKRRLSSSDFERAEKALAPAERYVELLDEREDAREELTAARKAAVRCRGALDDEIDRHERLQELAGVDLDVPTDRLREPLERYNAAVREGFDTVRETASARELFAFVERTRWYPLVPYERPPDDLREFVVSNPAGERSIPTLLEFADYSRSKLAHHVDDADELKRRVATQQTYLSRLDADPLTIEWPPAPAAELRYRIRELRPLVERLDRERPEGAVPADGRAEEGDRDDSLVGMLREIRELTREPEYERLRTAAVASDRLDPAERERLGDGRVADRLAELEAERDRLEAALEETESN